MIWPPPDPPHETALERARRWVHRLGFFGITGFLIFVLILLWAARDWFGTY